MIFAKVDVTFPQHHRVLRLPRKIRASALGVWLTALCYTRGNDLDGYVPGEALDMVASKAILDELVTVGLFAAHEKDGVHGYIVLRYAEHNETKADVQRRRNDTRERVTKHRKQNGNTLLTRVEPSAVPDSDSDSGSGSPSSSLPSEKKNVVARSSQDLQGKRPNGGVDDDDFETGLSRLREKSSEVRARYIAEQGGPELPRKVGE